MGVTIRAVVTVAGDEVSVDFDGTDPQVPVNCNAVTDPHRNPRWRRRGEPVLTASADFANVDRPG